ncbi:hypothetical protein PIB30_019763 [Stylosanthes scabra]|uniref:Uncharacterized protein n=1 Tax=Stylosanthes scabra TaxID=79078 RepID=A0ABU6X767_9FABA|nr:hypothetical protein [Stylosanthes scabra]
MGLDDHFIKPDGSIELPIIIRKGNTRKNDYGQYETDAGTFETLHGIERQPKPAENRDLLDFTLAGMLCKYPSVVSHSIAVDPNHRPMAQGKETDVRTKGPRGEETNQGALRSRIH